MKSIPIYLNRDTVAVIQIYRRVHKTLDLWISDFDDYKFDDQEVYEQAARQFINHLEEYWTPGFMTALMGEIDRALKRYHKKFKI